MVRLQRAKKRHSRGCVAYPGLRHSALLFAVLDSSSPPFWPGGVAGRISLNPRDARDAVGRTGQLESRGTMTLVRGEEGPRPHSTLLAGISIPHYYFLEAQDPGALAISRDSIVKITLSTP